MRDLAISPDRIAELLGATLSLAWTVVTVVLIISAAVLRFAQPLGLEPRLVGLAIAMGLAGLGDYVGGCWGAVLRAREDQEIQAAGFALHKIVTLILIFPALAAGLGLPGIVAAHMMGTLVQWSLYRWVVRRRYARPQLKFNFALWRYLLRESLPVGAAVDAWRAALVRNSDLLAPALYLTRGYTLVGRYYEAAEVAQAIIPKVIDPNVRGYLYSNLADAELAMGNLQPAHDAYFKSYYYNYVNNRHALASLVGP
jgi:O-antigen/teichoic acid export membrane protein